MNSNENKQIVQDLEKFIKLLEKEVLKWSHRYNLQGDGCFIVFKGLKNNLKNASICENIFMEYFFKEYDMNGFLETVNKILIKKVDNIKYLVLMTFYDILTNNDVWLVQQIETFKKQNNIK